MRKILVTGFEPFGEQNINSSWETAILLARHIGNFDVITLQVPVVFGKAAEYVIKAASDLHPDIILCLGQASGRSSITPEYVAINLRNASMPDNSGYEPHDEAIIPEGPAAYFSTLPVRKIAFSISDAGIKSDVSYSAGTYVCNDLMYSLLHHYNNTGIKVGFIHIPLIREQISNYNTEQSFIELHAAVKAIATVIETME